MQNKNDICPGTSRRGFLRQSAALSAAAITATCAKTTPAADSAIEDASDLPIIDTHQHLWDLDLFRLPWVRGNPKLNRSFLAAVISGRPAEAGFDDYIRPYAGNPYIKGVRQILHAGTPAGFCLQPAFVRSMKRLPQLGT